MDRYLPASMSVHEWDFDGLSAAVENMGLASEETKPEALEEYGGREAVAINLKDIAAERLEARAKEIGDDWPLLERLVLLRTIDSIWVEHLTELDEMRQGIGLRGLAQEDPLNAYKKEAFGLFEEMRALIRHQVATTIFRVQLVRQAAPPPAGVEGRGGEPGAEPAGAGSDGGAGTASGAGGPASNGRAGAASPARGGPLPAGGLPKALPQGRAMGGSTTSADGEPRCGPARLLAVRQRGWVVTTPAGAARERSTRSATAGDLERAAARPAGRSAGVRDRRRRPDRVHRYRVWDVGQHDNRRKVDAIVVLGAAQYNGRPSAVLAARLDHAIDLYNQGYATGSW